MVPRVAAAEQARLWRPGRRRAVGEGRTFALARQDRLLAMVVWPRHSPTYAVVGFPFGVGKQTTRRATVQDLPRLEDVGRDAIHLPDPSKGHCRDLDALLPETPELTVITDAFEQRVQRPTDRAEAETNYSGKKKAYTLKRQLALDVRDGRIADIAPRVSGPTQDLTLLKASGSLSRVSPTVGEIDDLAYAGIQDAHPTGPGATPRQKPPSSPAHQRMCPTTSPLRVAVSSWSILSGGCASSRRWREPIATTPRGPRGERLGEPSVARMRRGLTATGAGATDSIPFVTPVY